jgi:predicted MFS family arabinose efflux permease
MAITSMVAQALILMFLVEAHSKQLSTVAIGVVLAASGAGGAVGSFCSRIVPTPMRNLWLPIQMVAWSVALAFLGLAGGQSAYFSAFAMFILGLTGAIGNVEFGTYLIRNVSDDMIAKVTGIGQMLAIGACGLGPVLGGAAVQHFHVKGAIWILLGIVISLAFFSLLMPDMPRQVAQAFQAIKLFIPGDGHALRANLMVFKHVLALSAGADSGQNRDASHEAIAGRDPSSC